MVSYEDLPQEAQDAFDEAMEDFDDGVDSEAAREKYADGVALAIEENAYAEGLADRFNLDTSQIATAGDWEDAVSDVDPEEWTNALQRAGVSEKFRNNLVTGITEG